MPRLTARLSPEHTMRVAIRPKAAKAPYHAGARTLDESEEARAALVQGSRPSAGTVGSKGDPAAHRNGYAQRGDAEGKVRVDGDPELERVAGL